MTNEEILKLGELSGKMDMVLSQQTKQGENIGKVFDTLAKLPCSSHTETIEALQVWKSSCNGTDRDIKVEKAKGSISLKNSLILIGVTAVTTGLATKIIEAIFH